MIVCGLWKWLLCVYYWWLQRQDSSLHYTAAAADLKKSFAELFSESRNIFSMVSLLSCVLQGLQIHLNNNKKLCTKLQQYFHRDLFYRVMLLLNSCWHILHRCVYLFFRRNRQADHKLSILVSPLFSNTFVQNFYFCLMIVPIFRRQERQTWSCK